MEETRMVNSLVIGDEVMWSGSWGNALEEPAIVERIVVCMPEGTDVGPEVSAVHWSCVKDRKIVVDLANGHWAWGCQIREKN